jgi:hypothetical protein
MQSHPTRRRPSLSLDRFRVAAGVESRWYGAQVILVRPGGRCHSLSGLAPRIWSLVVRGTSTRFIVKRLHHEIGAPVERLESEISMMLQRLWGAGLIERRTG